ncbi:tRNA epoxyqueuosine(34) reductase QueG [Wukongibacter baidiensis]|uniref:tRNA epoxyqueuosine(34) reductase QueG n=1 Tax=Wukongibacter baidiensis TaxID=1723361 RepID=UPI003D7FB0F1
MITKEKIIKYAKEIDIDLIGFTKAEVYHDLSEILKEREAKGFLSGFEEKDIEKRINPQLSFEDVKTIIVVGISYYVKKEDVEATSMAKLHGKISRSSWGKDYHNVLRDRMKNLSEYITKHESNFEFKYYVDTGPLVDRHLAYKAGIGWYGKNNCIISKDHGSWIFIGYILSNLELEAVNKDTILLESQAADMISNEENISCKDCNECIKACPTNAIMKNYQYNSKLCISYLTQTKDDIDYRLREKMGNSLYGCDICQMVCPYNKGITTSCKDFVPESEIYKPDLLELLKLSNKQFKKKFGETALSWRGNRIIKRNAIIAIGNSGKKEVLHNLVEYLNNPSVMIRKYTAWAIMRLDKERGKKILDEYLNKEEESEIIDEIKKLYSYYL